MKINKLSPILRENRKFQEYLHAFERECDQQGIYYVTRGFCIVLNRYEGNLRLVHV